MRLNLQSSQSVLISRYIRFVSSLPNHMRSHHDLPIPTRSHSVSPSDSTGQKRFQSNLQISTSPVSVTSCSPSGSSASNETWQSKLRFFGRKVVQLTSGNYLHLVKPKKRRTTVNPRTRRRRAYGLSILESTVNNRGGGCSALRSFWVSVRGIRNFTSSARYDVAMGIANLTIYHA